MEFRAVFAEFAAKVGSMFNGDLSDVVFMFLHTSRNHSQAAASRFLIFRALESWRSLCVLHSYAN